MNKTENEEKTIIAKVWYCDRQNLKCENKKVTIIPFRNMKLTILKEERNNDIAEVLLQDKKDKKIYWEFFVFPVRLNLLLNDKSVEEFKGINDYKDNFEKTLINVEKELKEFWTIKIKANNYFNKCELEYIKRYIPSIYERAKESRRIFEMNKQNERKKETEKREKEINEKVEKVNENFERIINDMKYRIFLGEKVSSKDIEFYKDGKYENGLTIQNNFLYLAQSYGINIPLATKGFINNRLVDYNFKEKQCHFTVSNKNKKCSEKMYEYLDQVYKKVKEEYREKLKIKDKKVKAKEL